MPKHTAKRVRELAEWADNAMPWNEAWDEIRDALYAYADYLDGAEERREVAAILEKRSAQDIRHRAVDLLLQG